MTKKELEEGIKDLSDDAVILFVPSFELEDGDMTREALAYVDKSGELEFIDYIDVVESISLSMDDLMQGPAGEA